MDKLNQQRTEELELIRRITDLAEDLIESDVWDKNEVNEAVEDAIQSIADSDNEERLRELNALATESVIKIEINLD